MKIGTKVKHNGLAFGPLASLGVGTVTAFDGKNITVEFSTKTLKLPYPDAFAKTLTAQDPAVQEEAKQLLQAKAQEEETAKKQRQEEMEQRVRAESAPAQKKPKDIRSMFAADYYAKYLDLSHCLTYQEVERDYGIQISGFGRGINPIKDSVVLISSINKANDKFVYHDHWTVDGQYIYSGEGKNGDQTMTAGNLAIKNAEKDGKVIHLFVKFSPQEYYYQGEFTLVEYTHENEKDEEGNLRKEYKFKLGKVVKP